MDVSRLAHFDIMGHDREKLKTVTMETYCNVHFPETNNEVERNMVTVFGDFNGVEKVRAHIRVCKLFSLSQKI